MTKEGRKMQPSTPTWYCPRCGIPRPPLSRYVDLAPFKRELQRLGLQAQVRVPTLNRLMDI